MGGRRLVQNSRNPPNTGQANINLTPSESDIFKAIRLWLLKNVLPSPWTVQQGQQNRAPTTQSQFVVMQIITRTRYATNSHLYNKDGSITLTKPEKMAIQITCFGNGAGNIASLINTLWRDSVATEWFSQNIPNFAPLYASSLRQSAFVNAEHQYEDQWNLDLYADVHTKLTFPSESALHLNIKQITNADNMATISDCN